MTNWIDIRDEWPPDRMFVRVRYLINDDWIYGYFNENEIQNIDSSVIEWAYSN